MNNNKKITNNSQNTPLVNFPYEVLVLIARHLECSGILNMSRVCSVFHQCVYEDVLGSALEVSILVRKISSYNEKTNKKDLLAGLYFMGVVLPKLLKEDNPLSKDKLFDYTYVLGQQMKCLTDHASKLILNKDLKPKRASITDRISMFIGLINKELVEKREAQKELSLLKTLKNLSYFYNEYDDSVRDKMIAFSVETIHQNGLNPDLRKIAFVILMEIATNRYDNNGDGIKYLSKLLPLCPCKDLQGEIASRLVDVSKRLCRSPDLDKQLIIALLELASNLKYSDEIRKTALCGLMEMVQEEESAFFCENITTQLSGVVLALKNSEETRKTALSVLEKMMQGDAYASLIAFSQLREAVLAVESDEETKEIALSALIELAQKAYLCERAIDELLKIGYSLECDDKIREEALFALVELAQKIGPEASFVACKKLLSSVIQELMTIVKSDNEDLESKSAALVMLIDIAKGDNVYTLAGFEKAIKQLLELALGFEGSDQTKKVAFNALIAIAKEKPTLGSQEAIRQLSEAVLTLKFDKKMTERVLIMLVRMVYGGHEGKQLQIYELAVKQLAKVACSRMCDKEMKEIVLSVLIDIAKGEIFSNPALVCVIWELTKIAFNLEGDEETRKRALACVVDIAKGKYGSKYASERVLEDLLLGIKFQTLNDKDKLTSALIEIANDKGISKSAFEYVVKQLCMALDMSTRASQSGEIALFSLIAITKGQEENSDKKRLAINAIRELTTRDVFSKLRHKAQAFLDEMNKSEG